MKCYVCSNDLINQNETEEHIILNAIGGKLKSRRLICKKCNSNFGTNIDSKLAKQLNPISTLLNVKRDKGKPQNIRSTYKHKDILIEPGGKLKLARNYKEKNGDQIHIEATSIKAAKKVLKGLKRTYNNIDIEKQLKAATCERSFPTSISINMEFGGENTLRAFCKMAVNYYLLNDGNIKQIEHLIPYIRQESDEAEVYYFYPQTEVFYKNKKEIFHSLLLIGNPEQKILYVYIELFNEFKVIVYIDKDYNGEALNINYHYNVVRNEVVQFENSIDLSYYQLKKYQNKNLDKSYKKFKERLTYLMQQIDNVIVERRNEEIINNAMKKVNEKYPSENNPVWTKEMLDLFTTKIVEEFILLFQYDK